MSRTRDARSYLSQKLSEVMNDIGVNKRIIQKRRRVYTIQQTMLNIVAGDQVICHIMGSQIEGSTTLGLKSDRDILMYSKENCVVQNLFEWKEGVTTFLMIQNDNIRPGYCYLQLTSSHLPRVMSPSDIYNIPDKIKQHIAVNDGRLLMKNTFAFAHRPSREYPLHGPSVSCENIQLNYSIDNITAFYGNSLLRETTQWIQTQRERQWPTEEVLRNCEKSGYFVIGVGRRVSDRSQLEWRISTYLQERYIMLSLNITQLNCYILSKIFLKTHINPHVQDVLSSYMCKNVLWYCIDDSPNDWRTETLLSKLHVCLSRLRNCVQIRDCPHFIIPGNNLLSGKMSETQRSKILDIMDKVVDNHKKLLYGIQIDDLGRRLNIKLKTIPQCLDIPTKTQMSKKISSELMQTTVLAMDEHRRELLITTDVNLIERVSQILTNLTKYQTSDDVKPFPNTDVKALHAASKLLIPLVSSTLGSLLASRDIASNRAISYSAMQYLEAGKDSDALSGRLKLLSVLYCTGDMEKAERELDRILRQFDESSVSSVCKHYIPKYELVNETVLKACDEHNEGAIRSHVAVCTDFGHLEIHCVPHELKFELLRNVNKEERQKRLFLENKLMDNICVDSVPYLYFLQYKIYGRLQKREEQMQGLNNFLRCSCDGGKYYGHKDSLLHLLGQCNEQENLHGIASMCYIQSLRTNNNAARFLLCLHLFKLLKQKNLI